MQNSDDSVRRLGAPVSTRLMLALMMTMAGATSIGCGDDEDDDGDADAAVTVDAGRDARVPNGDDEDEDEDDASTGEDEDDAGEVVDDDDAGEVDEDDDAGEVDEDAGETDAGMDAGGDDAGDAAASDAGADAGPAPLTGERLWTTGLSPARADRFNAVAFSRNSQKIYAAGYVTDIVPSSNPAVYDRKFAVAAFNLDGSLDTAFGGNGDGIAKVNVVAATTVAEEVEQAKGIAVQTGGQIVVVGTFRKSTTARTFDYTPPAGGAVQQIAYTENDDDSVIVRLTATGALDTTFGAGDADGRDGLIIRSLSTPGATVPATANPPAVSQTNEDLPGVAIDGQNRIVLFAAARMTNRFDNDRVLFRLTATGAQDTAFGTQANNYAYSYSSPGSFNENAKTGVILADDGIISPGYTNIGGFNSVVVARVNANGAPITGWGNESNGITQNPFANATTPAASGVVEAYSAALQSTGHFVTTGYGRVESVPGGTNPVTSLLSLRFDSDGKLDTEWGNRGGYTQIDTLNGETTASAGVEQGRTAVALPDDRILMGGNGTPGANSANGNAGDAIAVLLQPNGELDTSFYTYGTKSFNLGGTNDAFYGSAVSPNGEYAVLAGYSTTAGTLTSDNAALLIYQIGE